MLILKDVHYVHGNNCRKAWVEDHGVDVAHLYVYPEWRWSMADGPPDPLPVPVCCVEYDAKGSPGTWHAETDCPRKQKLRTP